MVKIFWLVIVGVFVRSAFASAKFHASTSQCMDRGW